MPRSIFWHRRTRTSEPRQGSPHILVVWQAGSRIGSSALDILTTLEPISQGALPHWMLCSSRIGQTSDIICTREELQYLLRKWHHRRHQPNRDFCPPRRASRLRQGGRCLCLCTTARANSPRLRGSTPPQRPDQALNSSHHPSQRLCHLRPGLALRSMSP